MKLAGAESMRKGAAHLEVPFSTFRMIGLLEVAAAAGLVAGLWWRPLTAAAATGLCALMIGAMLYHRRAGDPAGEIAPAAILGLLALVTAVLAALTL
jgi:hypothetical protein